MIVLEVAGVTTFLRNVEHSDKLVTQRIIKYNFIHKLLG